MAELPLEIETPVYAGLSDTDYALEPVRPVTEKIGYHVRSAAGCVRTGKRFGRYGSRAGGRNSIPGFSERVTY